MEIIKGRIKDISKNGIIDIVADYSNIDICLHRKYDIVDIGLNDGRKISIKQRQKSYCLLKEIADWVGDMPEQVKNLMKIEFIVNRMQAIEKKMFSLADCDMTTAREFISFLIDFIIENDIPTKCNLFEQCEDISKYVYTCLKFKKCAICGEHADLHHFNQIGIGNNRTELFQIGMKVLPLCRKHHVIAHSKGKNWVVKDMHLTPISLNEEIAKIYKLSNKSRGK